MKKCVLCNTTILDGEDVYLAPNGDAVHGICLMGYVIENCSELGFKKEECEDGDTI